MVFSLGNTLPWTVVWLSLFGSVAQAANVERREWLQWSSLSELPVTEGRVAPFAGVSNGCLVVAGGASFSEIAPGDLNMAVWHDEIFVLPAAHQSWVRGFKLPRPVAYGCSVTTPRGLVCIGGRDSDRAFADVILLEWTDDQIRQTPLPSLPRAMADAAAAVVGDTIYVAGGKVASRGGQLEASHEFLALDVTVENADWVQLEPWPGPARYQAAVASQDGTFLLFGGVADGQLDRPSRKLRDAYRFFPADRGGAGAWRRIQDAPLPLDGVPSPGAALGQSHVALFGVAGGGNADSPDRAESGTTLLYHTYTDTWVSVGAIPLARRHVPVVKWRGQFVLPGGENPSGEVTGTVQQAAPVLLDRGFGLANYAVLVLYLFALVAIGWYFSRREKGTGDFFLGGRRVPWWAAGISIYATMLSAISFMGVPAISFTSNWARVLNSLTILLVAPLIVFFYLPFYRQLNVTSAYEYLELRFNLAVRLLGSSLFLLFQVGRMGIVLFLPALALSAVTGIDKVTCILLMGVLATLYTYLGGIEAVIWTDVLQIVVLMGGALIILLVIVGRLDNGWQTLFEIGVAKGKFELAEWHWDHTSMVVFVLVAGGFCENLYSHSSDQTIVQRYLTTKDQSAAVRSIWTNMALSAPGTFLFFFIGTALFVYYQAHPGQLNPTLQTDAIVPWFVAQNLPAGVAGLVIAGIFAAAMSSLDSSMNSMTTAIVTDFYRRLRTSASDHECLLLARRLTILLGVVGTGTALLLATFNIRSLLDQYQTIIGLFAGGLAGLFALGIFTRRAHGAGGLIGLVTSAAVQFYVANFTETHFLLYSATGVVSCFVVGYVASLIIPGRRKTPEGVTIYNS